MEKYCNNSWNRIVELLNSNLEQGLSEKKCEIIRRRYGSNKIELSNKNKIYSHIINTLKQKCFMIYILISLMLFGLKYYLFGYIISTILVINLILTIYHTMKRDKEINALDKLISTDTVVIRDGVQKTINSEELVVGDIVLIYNQCVVPADIRIINSDNLKVDEKCITGEEFDKKKSEEKIIGSISTLSEVNNILFKGSTIKSGDGLGIVIATGSSTQLGKILAMFTYASSRKHNFGKMICKYLEKYLLTYFIGTLIVGFYYIYSGQDIGKNNFATGLFALGCFPFLIITLFAYKKVIKKFLKDNIEILNFSVFNLIENINILFLDKVGSVSKKEMIVKKLYINDEIISTDDPYIKEITFDRIVDISLICNNGIYNASSGNGVGELDEIAFLKYAARKKIYKESINSKNTKLIDIPVEVDKQFSTVVTKLQRGCRANSRGNVDAILEQCTHIMINGIERELTEEFKSKIKCVDMNLSINGLINEGFAYRNFNYEPSKDENIESNMVFVGIMALENPLEDELENSITHIKDKAIVPILFTEESKLSAITNSKKAQIIKNSNQVVAGIELDSLNHKELKELLCRVRVFCRVNTEIKSKIVSLFIKDGHKVATTGESLGDLPSLNLSNVGISKGKASAMVKKISDVYIKENYLDGFFKIRNFSKVFHKNIEKTFKTYFMIILCELLVLLVSTIMGQVDTIDFWNIIVINGIIFIPLSIILLIKDGRDMSNNEMVMRAFILSIMSIISMYKVEGKEATIIPLSIISSGIILFTMFNSKISITKFSNELLMIFIAVLVVFLAVAVIISFNNIIPRDIIIMEICSSILFLLIFEILYGKWQNSLMR